MFSHRVHIVLIWNQNLKLLKAGVGSAAPGHVFYSNHVS